jgi:single-strand DNA-binding protein
MPTLNKTFLMGNLVKDPDYRDFGNGKGACTLRIANSYKFKNAAGQEQEEPLFVDVKTFGRTAATCRQFLSKGSKVLIEGRLKLDQWEKDGEPHQKLVIAAENVQFLSSNREQNNPPRPPADHPHGHRRPVVDSAYAPQMPDIPEGVAPEDDCPF